MNMTTRELLTEIDRLYVVLDYWSANADKSDPSDMQAVDESSERLANLLLELDCRLFHAGHPIDEIIRLRTMIVQVLDTQIQAQEHRAAALAALAVEQARRCTLH